MSKALDYAELIRTRLATAPVSGELATLLDLTDLDILVYEQKALMSQINTAVAKAKGTAVTIEWQGFGTVDKNAKRPRMRHRFLISVYSKPIIAGENLAATDVLESIINRLWHWIPGGGHAFQEVEVLNGGLSPDRKFLIYDCEVLVAISH